MIIVKVLSPLKILYHISTNNMVTMKNKIIVITGPSGVGKTSLSLAILKDFSDILHLDKCITYTTREMRPSEVDGIDYHFVDKADFIRRKEAGEFLETVERYGNLYGTNRLEIEKILLHKNVLMVLDVAGAKLLSDMMDVHSIFIAPVSYDILKKRLIERKTDDQQSIATRLSRIDEEMQYKVFCDTIIINDDFKIAQDDLLHTISSYLEVKDAKRKRILHK